MGISCSHIGDEAFALNKTHLLETEEDRLRLSIGSDECCCENLFQDGTCYSVRIKSSLSFLQPVINEITDNLVQNHAFPLEKQVDIFLVLSELLVNAIEHGNKNIYDKQVFIRYFVGNESVSFVIEDEGLGIDKNMLCDIKASQGLSLIKALVSCICWNEKGNKVCVNILI